MARELSREELDELLGAYALDAVDGDECDQIEQYLERSPRGRELVAEFRETAALLAHAGTPAPAGLWDRIEHALEEEPPRLVLPPPTVVGTRHRSRFSDRMRVAAVAAAVVLLIGVLGVKVVQQDHRIHEIAGEVRRGGGVLNAADAAVRDPRAQRVKLRSADGAIAARIVYLPTGEGYLTDHNLATLPSDQTYQLWAMVRGPDAPRAISAGVLGRDPDVTAFKVRGPVTGFVITEEKSPGVQVSRHPAVVAGNVS